MFFGLQVDRGNLVQAVADNLLNDLHLTTNGKLPSPPNCSPGLQLVRLQLWQHYFPLLILAG